MFALLRDSNLLQKKKRTLRSLDKNNKINRQEKESTTKEVTLRIHRGERYSWEFVVGVCHPVLQILALFPDQKVVFFHSRFQTWPLKFIPVLIPGVGRTYVIIIEIRAPAKRVLKIYLDFAYYSFFLIH